MHIFFLFPISLYLTLLKTHTHTRARVSMLLKEQHNLYGSRQINLRKSSSSGCVIWNCLASVHLNLKLDSNQSTQKQMVDSNYAVDFSTLVHIMVPHACEGDAFSITWKSALDFLPVMSACSYISVLSFNIFISISDKFLKHVSLCIGIQFYVKIIDV